MGRGCVLGWHKLHLSTISSVSNNNQIWCIHPADTPRHVARVGRELVFGQVAGQAEAEEVQIVAKVDPSLPQLLWQAPWENARIISVSLPTLFDNTFLYANMNIAHASGLSPRRYSTLGRSPVRIKPQPRQKALVTAEVVMAMPAHRDTPDAKIDKTGKNDCSLSLPWPFQLTAMTCEPRSTPIVKAADARP